MADKKPTKFAEIEGKQRSRGSGCARCGEPVNRGTVGPYLQSFGAKGGGLQSGKRVRSKTVSMCESCCVTVYLMLEELLLREAHMEHLIGKRQT